MSSHSTYFSGNPIKLHTVFHDVLQLQHLCFCTMQPPLISQSEVTGSCLIAIHFQSLFHQYFSLVAAVLFAPLLQGGFKSFQDNKTPVFNYYTPGNNPPLKHSISPRLGWVRSARRCHESRGMGQRYARRPHQPLASNGG